jgi:hypothetical protein
MEQQLDCRGRCGLALHHYPDVGVQVARAVHRQIRIDPVTRPQVELSDAPIVEASEAPHQRIGFFLGCQRQPRHPSLLRLTTGA